MVLWAVRGMNDSPDSAVRAGDVARFMAKDATLSEQFSRDDVTDVLETLVADGTLTHASTAASDAHEVDESTDTALLYRLVSGPDSLLLDSDSLHDGKPPRDEWDDWLRLSA